MAIIKHWQPWVPFSSMGRCSARKSLRLSWLAPGAARAKACTHVLVGGPRTHASLRGHLWESPRWMLLQPPVDKGGPPSLQSLPIAYATRPGACIFVASQVCIPHCAAHHLLTNSISYTFNYFLGGRLPFKLFPCFSSLQRVTLGPTTIRCWLGLSLSACMTKRRRTFACLGLAAES